MGKLTDFPTNISMICYYQRVLGQLLGCVASVYKDYKPLQPIVCYLSFKILLFPFSDICKSMTVSFEKDPNTFKKISSCFGQFNFFIL